MTEDLAFVKAIEYCIILRSTYLKLLNRNPDVYFVYYLEKMMIDNWSLELVEADIRSSDEYMSHRKSA